MSTEPTQPLRRRKKLNVTAIKTTIVFFVGMVIAVGGALTGLAAQAALAPGLRWMLGFAPEKAQGAALRFVCFAMFAALVGVSIGHGIEARLLLGSALAAFVGATLGALLVMPLAKAAAIRASRRLFLTAAMAVLLWTLNDSARLGGLHTHHIAPAGLLVVAGIGLAVGALTQVGGLPGGMLMVTGLYFLGGFSATQAIATSLLVIVLAALLPAWSYAQRGLVDPDYGGPTITGGILGGFGGGIVLAHADPKPVLLLFTVVAMYLCARELYQLSLTTPDPSSPPAQNPES